MTYSLDTLKTQNSPITAATGGVRRFTQEVGLILGLLGLLFWLLALVSYSPQDAAWSTSGKAQTLGVAQSGLLNWGGRLGAYLADASYFLLGFSVWWLLAAGLSVWLAALARWLRADTLPGEQPHSHRIKFWLGLLLLLAASSGLEWSRLYRFEARLPDHSGGAIGYWVGSAGVKWLGFAGSGLVLIAVGVMTASAVFGFSWAQTAQRLGEWISSLIESRREQREIAEDLAVGKKAAREREEILIDERIEIEEHHPAPRLIEPTFVDIPKSELTFTGCVVGTSRCNPFCIWP